MANTLLWFKFFHTFYFITKLHDFSVFIRLEHIAHALVNQEIHHEMIIDYRSDNSFTLT